jgi:hypothetical protein
VIKTPDRDRKSLVETGIVISTGIMSDTETAMEENGATQGEEQQEQQVLPDLSQQPQTATASQPAAATTASQQGRKAGNKKQPDHPCVACGKNVTSNAVQCTMCTL